MFKKSLFTLGILPMTTLAFQIGAWVGGPGKYPQPTAENVQAFQNLQGSHLDLINHFALFDINDWENVKQYADVAKANGSTLIITWMPNGYCAQDIVDGKTDNYIREFAKGVKKFGDEIWLRPLHEANGDWYDWGVGKAGAGNTDANVAEAFRHIVKLFREETVSNVKWVWTTNASNHGSGTTYTGNYPGDDYVDYISIDGYNWGKSQAWSNWQTFAQVFKESYDALSNINKPLFIAEISSSEKGGNKAEWITDMFEQFQTNFSRVFAVMWFSQSKDYEGDWALNTSQAAVDAWKAGIAKMQSSK
jgi:endoglucanase